MPRNFIVHNSICRCGPRNFIVHYLCSHGALLETCVLQELYCSLFNLPGTLLEASVFQEFNCKLFNLHRTLFEAGEH